MDGRLDTAASRQATRLDAIQGRFDPWLLGCFIALASLGLVMVASSSLAIAESRGQDTLHYFIRHVAFLVIGVMLAGVAMTRGDIRRIEQYSRWLPILGIVLLLVVAIPGLGHTVNGARRWVRVAGIGFQPAESVKLLLIVWLASYLARFSDEVKGAWVAMYKAFGVALAFSAILLVLHKDFGTTALVLGITAGMMLLGGVHLSRLVLPGLIILPLLGLTILLEPYRVQRFISFRDPWKDPFGDGYQLTNALMAVGRGEFSGVGLGGSVQKLSYLPEAYTDFIMAVIAEELGFVGVCMVIALYAVLVGRALWIGLQCVDMRRHFAGYVAFGIALWLAAQAFVSIGVNLGLLPTKGLTLPLVSSGGSSILVTCLAMGLLLRVSWELERARRQVALRRDAVAPSNVVATATSATHAPAMDATAAHPAAVKPMHEAANHAANDLADAGERTRGTIARLLDRAPKSLRDETRGTSRRERIEPSFGSAPSR